MEQGPASHVVNMENPRLVNFHAGSSGTWTIRQIRTVCGEPLPPASCLEMSQAPAPEGTVWTLLGVKSHERYTHRAEKEQLLALQEGLGRPASRHAALIPIKKSAAWWSLSQDERRAIFEEQSHHTADSLKYLPSIARSLHHCRDLGTNEPFDFLTWFEFDPVHEPDFDQLVTHMRTTPEWKYVERETDIRLSRP
jgi:chlorite dismutase